MENRDNRIGIDVRPMESHSKNRGIGYYTYNSISQVLEIANSNTKFILYRKFISNLSGKLKRNNTFFWAVPTPLRPLRLVRRYDPMVSFFWNLAIKFTKPKLIHLTSLFEVYYIALPKDTKIVITIYDLIPLVFQKYYFKDYWSKKWYLDRLENVKKASKIITISESSKKDLVRFLKIPEEKIKVIYCGIGKQFKPLNKRSVKKILASKYKINSPYILAVGSTTINKNVTNIFKAFKIYIQKNKDEKLKLIVVCMLIYQEKKSWNKLIKELNLEDRVILTNFIPDKDVPLFYNGAKVLLFPSLYEGFGLPIIEAMACGLPVITSNLSSMPEVAGEAAFYVNPKSLSSISNGIEQILSNKKLQNQMIKKGFKQARKFNWKKAATQTLKLYEEVLESERPS